jgi:hypothetical protein
LRERRRADLSGPRPSLNVSLRKLKLFVFEATPGRAACAFVDRAMGTAMIAAEAEAPPIQTRLEDLACRVLAHPERDWRPLIYRELERLDIEICALA